MADLTTTEKKLLQIYVYLHDRSPTGLTMVRIGFRNALIISSPPLVAAIYCAVQHPTPATVSLWAMFALAWVSALLPLLMVTYFEAERWRIIEEIVDWERVQELLGRKDSASEDATD